MDCQPLVPGAEVRRGAEHVRADEHAAVGPPERDFLPGTAVLDGDAGERTERALRDALAVDRVDHPDAAVHDEGVRAPLHELVDDPAEAPLELVAEADSHPGESTGTR